MTDDVIKVPALGLVLLIGISGSGKSTFARRNFAATQVISSDFCRGLVADDENDQDATADAFDVLEYIVGTRLRRGLLTVVDATNVQQSARASLLRLAKEHDVMTDAIVLDVPVEQAIERNHARTDRVIPDRAITRQAKDLKRSLGRLKKERFRRVHVLRGERIDAVRVEPEASWNDRRELTGPFDVIGDVHGCASELVTLLERLGWTVHRENGSIEGRPVGAEHPQGRTAVFVGDLVDRGPDTPGVLRLVMGMVAAGTALCVSGNHEAKLVRALRGAQVKHTHGIAESLAQLADEPEEFRRDATTFMDGLIAHYVLDGGRLVVAHAGLKERYHGRSSGRVRSFALYGDTTGETDEYGLPVRYPWAEEYRGAATVVYGHTPVPRAEWVNNTICLDTGVVFGGELTALRYPERELVAVPAEREWYQPVRPLHTAAATERDGSTLRIEDVAGDRWLTGEHSGRVKIPEENAAAALEVMSRFAVDPRWLVYLPPTMSPAPSSRVEGYLEHPQEAFDAYAKAGVSTIVCEEKHMGSRAIAVLAKDEQAASRRFGIADGTLGVVHTRTGRPFFSDPAEMAVLVERVRAAVAPLFDELDSDWLVLDGELLPWSAKAGDLIRSQFATVGAAAQAALPADLRVLERARERGLEVDDLIERLQRRLANARSFADAYGAFVAPGEGPAEVRFAPFQVLASAGRLLGAEEPNRWHLDRLAPLWTGPAESPVLTPTRFRQVDLADPAERGRAVDWWLDLTAAGAEGMVVKPLDVPALGGIQPGLKVRGREYLRIVYGPDYLDDLERLRGRNLGRKRQLALTEHRLGLDALGSFVAGEPGWAVHRFVFGILALESEPVDPRL